MAVSSLASGGKREGGSADWAGLAQISRFEQKVFWRACRVCRGAEEAPGDDDGIEREDDKRTK